MRISIEDRSIFQLLVPCPMRLLLITIPECQACPFHGGLSKERHHFPDDSYVTGYIDCLYPDEIAEKSRGTSRPGDVHEGGHDV